MVNANNKNKRTAMIGVVTQLLLPNILKKTFTKLLVMSSNRRMGHV